MAKSGFSAVGQSVLGQPPRRLLKNYLRCHRCVKNRLVRESGLGAPIKMLIYNT
jgi:hypothetical protein